MTFDKEIAAAAIAKSKSAGLPLIVCLIGTKACYIKFAGLVHALVDADYPFISIESGQHYEPFLKTAGEELGYAQHLHGSLEMKGGLTEKSSLLFSNLSSLYEALSDLGCKNVLLAVIGDTLSAGVGALAWYFATGQRSMHVEAGLRSLQPMWTWCPDLLSQRFVPWGSIPTRPFPEGQCTRLASACSQVLMAPVERNTNTLIAEGVKPSAIFTCGSLSVDAVALAKKKFSRQIKEEPRMRVDIHRRENLTRACLVNLFGGLARIASEIPVELCLTKSMQNVEGHSWDQDDISLLRKSGVEVSLQAVSYVSVVERLASGSYSAIYTDSGGLQEETCILGVPCMTCRFETDRPETVLDFKTNVLIPPRSSEFIAESVLYCMTSEQEMIWPGLQTSALVYGSHVGDVIIDRLKSITLEPNTSTDLK